jgi:hypothetical protein
VPKDFGKPGDEGDSQDEGPCVPAEIPGDWCDGKDNDCNGEVDEGAKPLAFSEDFSESRGWLRKTPTGPLNHVLGPIAFADFTQANNVAWLPMTPWQGDIELDASVLIGSLAPGAQFFIGTYSTIDGAGQWLGRSGTVFTRQSDIQVRADIIVNDELLASVVVPSNEILRILFTVNNADGQARTQLLRGDGSLVDQASTNTLTTVPNYGGLLVAVEGGAVVGSVSRIKVGGGFNCEASETPLCVAADCVATELCQFDLCNPFMGCQIVPKYCAPANGCLLPAVCNGETGKCSQETKANGESCELGCITGATCNEGVCEGGESVVCDGPGACQEEATCVPAFNQCVFPNKADGLECDDSNSCTQGDQCIEGECQSGIDTTCPENGLCESESSCNPETGQCSLVEPLEDGSGCDDGDPCTDTDICTGGACAGVDKVCDDGNQCTTDSCGVAGCEYVAGGDCEIWSTQITGLISGPPAVHELVVFVAAETLAAINADSGELLWESQDVVDCTSPIHKPRWFIALCGRCGPQGQRAIGKGQRELRRRGMGLSHWGWWQLQTRPQRSLSHSFHSDPHRYCHLRVYHRLWSLRSFT